MTGRGQDKYSIQKPACVYACCVPTPLVIEMLTIQEGFIALYWTRRSVLLHDV